MSDCISPSDLELAQRLMSFTEAGMPLVEDPWAWLAERMELPVEETLALLQRTAVPSAVLPRYPTITAWGTVTTA